MSNTPATTNPAWAATRAAAPELRDFSIVRAGPFWRLVHVGILGGRRLQRTGVIVALFSWIPLVALSGLQHVFMKGAVVAFYQSLGTHARLLVAIPLMFAAEAWFDERTRGLLQELATAGVITPAGQPRFARILRRAVRLVDSWAVEAALVILTVLLLASGARADLPGTIPTWRGVGGVSGLTWAGWWYTLVSMPIFQFLIWRWCWRLLVWGWILWQTTRLDLQLVPSHPDLAGGLGALGLTQVSLSPLTFGLSGMLVASYAEDLLYGGGKLDSLVLPLASIVVGVTAAVFAPLVFFTPKLLWAKEHGLLEYGKLASAYTQAFAGKWITGPPAKEELLGTADLQSLADLANSFQVVRNMRLVPCSWNDIMMIALSTILPMLPLLLVVLPLNELIVRGAKMMLGL